MRMLVPLVVLLFALCIVAVSQVIEMPASNLDVPAVDGFSQPPGITITITNSSGVMTFKNGLLTNFRAHR